MDGKIYKMNEEVEVEEGKKTLRRENNKNCGGGKIIKLWSRE